MEIPARVKELPEIHVSVVSTEIDVQINPIPGIGGLTTKEVFQRRSETRFFTPEHPDQFQGAIIVPGFGHTIDRVGEPFVRWARRIAAELHLTTQ